MTLSRVVDALHARASLLPTTLGVKAIAFYGMLLCSFYAAPYLNLFFLLLCFLSVLGILGAYWSFMNLASVSGEIQPRPPFPAGAGAVFHATLSCGSRSRHHLRLELQIRGEHLGAGHVAHAVGTVDVEGTLPPLERGVYDITHASVSSVHPFGLFRARVKLGAPLRLVVYPEPAELSHFRDRHELLTSLDQEGGHRAVEMGPAGLREYKPGDELRHVHWRASARRQALVVKEYEGDSRPGLEVLLDLRCSRDQLEASLSLITALAMISEDNKDVITLISQDHTATYGKGHRSINELWGYLAMAQPLPAHAQPPPSVSPGVVRLPGALDAHINASAPATA